MLSIDWAAITIQFFSLSLLIQQDSNHDSLEESETFFKTEYCRQPYSLVPKVSGYEHGSESGLKRAETRLKAKDEEHSNSQQISSKYKAKQK